MYTLIILFMLNHEPIKQYTLVVDECLAEEEMREIEKSYEFVTVKGEEVILICQPTRVKKTHT
jgi:hypothetical protein